LTAGFVFGATKLEAQYPTIFGKSLNDSSSIGDLVCYIFNAGLTLSISIAVCVIAWGGIYYLISYGRGSFTTEAQEWIKAGILGLLIIMCSSLILYTINPNIGSCKIELLSQLSPTNFTGSNSQNKIPKDATVATYMEYPIGTLTEALLTEVSVCPQEDAYGDLIIPPSSQQTGGGSAELSNKSMKTQDRVACLVGKVQKAEKIMQTASVLAQKINQLMDTCSCRIKSGEFDTKESKCEPKKCPDRECGQSCPSGFCTPADTPDCCPPGIKQIIEHGPIYIPEDEIANTNKALGTENTNAGFCTIRSDCTEGQVHDPMTGKCAKKYDGLDEFRCPEGEEMCSDNIRNKVIESGGGTLGVTGIGIITPEKWDSLNLWQKLQFYKEDILWWPTIDGIVKDMDNLQKVKTDLGKCYLITPYADLVASNEVTNQQKTIILKKAYEVYDDKQSKKINLLGTLTGKPIEGSKYCKGFNYNDSSCYKQCSDMCPDSDSEVMSQYAQCGQNSSQGQNQQNQAGQVNSCIKTAYTGRSCPYSEETEGTTFDSCMSSCRDECSSSCASEFPRCSSEYAFCLSQCENNGQCILNNSDKCLFGGQSFANCGKNSADDGNNKYCIEKAYTCENGSNLYAGYPDVVSSSAATSTDQKCREIGSEQECLKKNFCLWDEYAEKCFAAKTESYYSASWLWQNKENQKCTDINVRSTNNECKGGRSSTCGIVCPETIKGPTGSDCPSCPCNEITTITFGDPEKSNADTEKECENDADCYPEDNTKSRDYSCIPNKLKDQDDPPDGPAPSENSSPSTQGTNNDDSDEIKPPDTDVKKEKICMVNGKKQAFCNDDSQCDQGETCSPQPPSNPLVYDQRRYCIPNAGKEKTIPKTPKVSAYQITGPQCMEYGFNDDPLTFYCQDQWWNDPNKEYGEPQTAIGEEKLCKKENDIPVGQTVDDSILWARKIIASVNKDSDIIKGIKKYQDQMIKIGKMIDDGVVGGYCGCSARMNNEEPICSYKCNPKEEWRTRQVPKEVPVLNPDGTQKLDSGGSPMTETIMVDEQYLFCFCELEACRGNPCQQAIDFDAQLWNYFKKYKERDYMAFFTTNIIEPRSDILKELTYSRQQMSRGGVISTEFGGSQNRLLSCTRAMDELVQPINATGGFAPIKFSEQLWPGFCYGQNLSKAATSNTQCTKDSDCQQQGEFCSIVQGTCPTSGIPCTKDSDCQQQQQGQMDQNSKPPEGCKIIQGSCKLDLTDNWFSCEKSGEKLVPNNNPIFNLKPSNY